MHQVTAAVWFGAVSFRRWMVWKMLKWQHMLVGGIMIMNN